MRNIECIFVIGLLFVGMHVCTFQPGHFTGWDSEMVKSLRPTPQFVSHSHDLQACFPLPRMAPRQRPTPQFVSHSHDIQACFPLPRMAPRQ